MNVEQTCNIISAGDKVRFPIKTDDFYKEQRKIIEVNFLGIVKKRNGQNDMSKIMKTRNYAITL